MIFIKGDLHGEIDIHDLNQNNFPQQKEATKEDVLIILGDFGFVWGGTFSDSEKYWLDWLSKKNCTVCFLKGNHENHERLNSDEFPVVEKWRGTVKKIWDNVYMLETGQIYSIDGKKVLVFGGATSTDKHLRKNRISWWEEEVPSYKEFTTMMENTAKEGNKVDLVLSHTCPSFLLPLFVNVPSDDVVSKMLDWIHDNVEFREWYFGHLHMDHKVAEKYVCSYNKIHYIS